jgi:lipoprotein-releasing system ATP-binding protein
LDVQVLQGVDLQVKSGETWAIVGASGSGKSTLLHVLGGLDAPTQGTVHWLGENISRLSAAQLGRLRNQHLGFVYQFHHLLPEFSALENVAMPLWIRRQPKAQAAAAAEHLLAVVGLSGRLHHRPSELSGGERQRVAIARALVNNPSILLADEPTGNLDSKTSHEIMALFKELNEKGNTIIMVTHEEDIAAFAKRIVRLRDGVIESDLPNKDVRSVSAPAEG